MKWNSFNLMGADFYDLVKKICTSGGTTPSHPDAIEAMLATRKKFKDQLSGFIDSPCTVTVKLDGTNVGIDNKGLVVGRNTPIKEGETY
jgi:hypothetical protein